MRRKSAAAISTLLLVMFAASAPAACAETARPPSAARAAHIRRSRLTNARPSTFPATVTILPCPSDVVTLPQGAKLSEVAMAANKTYLLQDGGVYPMTSTIILDTPGTVTCYQSKPGSTLATVLVNVTNGSRGKRAWVVQNGARLGLQNIQLDGQDTSTGILAEQDQNSGELVLEVTGATFQYFVNVGQQPPRGAAVVLNNADATFRETNFYDNTCEQEGGALAVQDSNVILTGVDMVENTAASGGAMFIQGNSMVTIEGTDVLKNGMYRNEAVGYATGETGAGGAINVFEGSVMINGALDAESNDAGGGMGGFAIIGFGSMFFIKGSQVSFGLNMPDTVAAPAPEATVACDSAQAERWNPGTRYTISGPACACNDAFVAGSSNTCPAPARVAAS